MATMTKRRKALKPLTPREIRAIREGRGLSVEDAAALLNVSVRTWYSWETVPPERRPTGSALAMLYLLRDQRI